MDEAGTIKVIECTARPRARVNDLLEITCNMSREALLLIAHFSDEFAGKYPRYPKEITADTSLLKPEEIKVLSITELLSDQGIEELIKKATYFADEYPRIDAEILKFKKPRVRKDKASL